MSVIPTDFEPQSAKSNYTRLTPGTHRLRILSKAISGWEYWDDTPEGGRKPVRFKLDGNPPVAHAEDIRKFIAMPVWNYDLEKVQVWEVTQSSIQQELKSLDRDKDWGSLEGYDIEIERTGNDKNTTRYRLTPKPKSTFNEDITKAVIEGLPYLEALYVGADPFSTTEENIKEIVDEKDVPF